MANKSTTFPTEMVLRTGTNGSKYEKSDEISGHVILITNLSNREPVERIDLECLHTNQGLLGHSLQTSTKFVSVVFCTHQI